jgi:uncharacterized protein
MDTNANALNWFEIPAHDLDRAQHFYQNIFEMTMQRSDIGGMGEMAIFPDEPNSGKVGGAVVKSPFHVPSGEGSIVYLNGNPDLAHVLDRVHGHGGTVVMPKTHISDDIGYMAMFMDTEGNRVALHSNN